MNINVTKRNGTQVPYDASKINKIIEFACEGLDSCSASELGSSLVLQLVDGMQTKDILKVLIQTASEKVKTEVLDEYGNPSVKLNSNWEYVAGRLFIYDLYKECAINRNYTNFGYGDFKGLIANTQYGDYLRDGYTDEQIEELGNYIDMDRDELFNYDGVSLLASRYLVTTKQGGVLELPQERFMVVAMHLGLAEKPEERIEYVKKFYDLMSLHKMTVATPTLANAGKSWYQLSSCFISTVGDDLWSIYDVNQKFAQVSKHGGALGIYTGKIRSLNSEIRGNKDSSGGVVPWIRLYNDTAVAVDQLGTRKGSCSVTLDIWHKDILEFLEIKRNNGDDRRKAHDVFPAVSIPNLFMKLLKERETWCLFDPYEIRKEMGYDLFDFYDDGDNLLFTEKYYECVNNENISRVEIPTLELMKGILRSAFETGTPFIFFRDTVNEANPNKHCGMIYASNLCHEIAQNTSESTLVSDTLEDGRAIQITQVGDMVTCNLNSINLGRVTKEELKDVIPLQVRMLDNVITLNRLPIRDAAHTSTKYRAIGLGTSGYHQHLVQRGIKWETDEHLDYMDDLYEEINYQTIKASMELAKEREAYPMFKGSEWETGKYFERRDYNSDKWNDLKAQVKENGMRNGYLLAIAPTGSTSNIVNSTAGIDPIYKKYFTESKKGRHSHRVAPSLSDENFWLYKEAHTINQDWSIKACARRQRHIDQAQSFNLYITPDTPAKDILDMYVKSWENGIKTIYYIRNQSAEISECVSCSS